MPGFVALEIGIFAVLALKFLLKSRLQFHFKFRLEFGAAFTSKIAIILRAMVSDVRLFFAKSAILGVKFRLVACEIRSAKLRIKAPICRVFKFRATAQRPRAILRCYVSFTHA